MSQTSSTSSLAIPALLIGLGARILFDKVSGADPSFSSNLLIGIWQGICLLYSYKNSDFSLVVGVGAALKVFFELSSDQDVSKALLSVTGTGLGFVLTDVLTQMLDDPSSEPRTRDRHSTSSNGHRDRDRDEQRPHRRRRSRRHTDSEVVGESRRQAFREAVSDITSVETLSEFTGPHSGMTPLERDVATLKTRAALADSERRRFKEERKWAVSQGNTARAEQMAWQVKRYSALMKSFLREADAKMSEAEASGVENSPRRSTPHAHRSRSEGRKSRRTHQPQANGHAESYPSPEPRASTSRANKR